MSDAPFDWVAAAVNDALGFGPGDPNALYVLDDAARPVRIYNLMAHCRWRAGPGQRFELRDALPEYRADVWTQFAGVELAHTPPRFSTTLRASGGVVRTFYSRTWEEAQDKHHRVIAKVRRVEGRIGWPVMALLD